MVVPSRAVLDLCAGAAPISLHWGVMGTLGDRVEAIGATVNGELGMAGWGGVVRALCGVGTLGGEGPRLFPGNTMG